MTLRMLLCAFALILAAVSPAAADICATLTKAYPGAPCHLDLAKVRTSEPFLAWTAFPGRTWRVRNAAEAGALHLAPGDTVILNPGPWPDTTLTIRANGTPDRPILIQGTGAVFTGTGSAAFSGSNLIIRGLTFRQGAVARDKFVVFRLGDGADAPCNRCTADRITIEGYNSDPAAYATRQVFYMVLYGRDITLANSRLADKKNTGTMIAANLPAAGPQRLLMLHNTISNFGSATPDRDHDHMVMQLGASQVAADSAYSALIGNTFESITGDTDCIAIKASDVLVQGNVFRANRSGFDLRAANRVLIQNNLFDGAGVASMGGVRVEGAGHWIVDNTFRHLKQPANYYFWPIPIQTAADEDLHNGIKDYARAKDIVIAGNRFEDDQQPPIIIGIYPDPARHRILPPRDIYILGNSFQGPNPVGYIGDPAQYSHIVVR